MKNNTHYHVTMQQINHILGACTCNTLQFKWSQW